MKKRLCWAFGAYAVLLALAVFTLEGPFRAAILVVVAGLAVKTWLAYKRG